MIITEQALIHLISLLFRVGSGEDATNVRSRKQPSASNDSISICSSDEDDVAQKEKSKKRKRKKVHNITH